MMPLLEPRGADDDRFLRRGAGIERRLDRPWRGEIDQNVGHGRELRDIAALVNAAAALSRLRYRGRERDAHPARAADDADAGHDSSPFALRLSKGRPCSITALRGRAAPRQGSPERLPGSPRAQDTRSITFLHAMRNIVILTGAGVSAEKIGRAHV